MFPEPIAVKSWWNYEPEKLETGKEAIEVILFQADAAILQQHGLEQAVRIAEGTTGGGKERCSGPMKGPIIIDPAGI